jgi:hypothetical protein
LICPKLIVWKDLFPCIANLRPTQEQDVFHWNLKQKGQFSVKSHYSALIHQGVPNLNKIIWKTKAPLKIFMWYLQRVVVLTKDNLINIIGKAVRSVAFITRIRHLSTFSLDAALHG